MPIDLSSLAPASTDDTNAAALAKMRTNHVRSIVVVDDNRAVGIVKRDNLVAQLLEKLATPDK